MAANIFVFLVVISLAVATIGREESSNFRKTMSGATLRTSSGCPIEATISPCTCYSDYSGLIGVALNCNNKGLSDSQMSKILDAFLSSDIKPLLRFNAGKNSLTKVPDQILKLTSLLEIELYTNKITSIRSEFFSSPSATKMYISLYNNQITSIPPGMFNFPKATSVSISLSNNQITSIPSGMFNYPTALSIGVWLDSNQITVIPSGMFSYFKATGVTIWLANNKIASIPCGTFNFPSATGDVSLYLSSNQITAIVPGMFDYPFATSSTIWLQNNQISTIPAGTFNFPNAKSYLSIVLSSNKLTSIEVGAFTNTAKLSNLYLNKNQLTQFPSSVYTSVLTAMAPGPLYLSGNRIDCSTCELSWLIRDNRQLLTTINSGTCSNGTAFTNLNSYGYANCP